MHDAEERRNRTVRPAGEGLKDRRTAGAETDPERRLGRLEPEGGERVGVHAGAVVSGDQGADRLPKLAQARDVGVRDANGRRDQPLLEQPCPRLRRRADPVPSRGEVVVPGIHEPLQQLEPSRCLRPAAGLDLLAGVVTVVYATGSVATEDLDLLVIDYEVGTEDCDETPSPSPTKPATTAKPPTAVPAGEGPGGPGSSVAVAALGLFMLVGIGASAAVARARRQDT